MRKPAQPARFRLGPAGRDPCLSRMLRIVSLVPGSMNGRGWRCRWGQPLARPLRRQRRDHRLFEARYGRSCIRGITGPALPRLPPPR